MDSTLVDQCRKDHKESRRGHIDLQKSPSSSYRSDKVKQCGVDSDTDKVTPCLEIQRDTQERRNSSMQSFMNLLSAGDPAAGQDCSLNQ